MRRAIYDISQKLFSCNVFPGDDRPSFRICNDMSKGDIYNLSAISLCSHNGTHVDAPRHFIRDGKTIDCIGLEKFAGPCYVFSREGDISGEDAEEMLGIAEKCGAADRILIKGKATVTEEAAEVFASRPISLIGNESQTVGPEDAPMKVHLILLEKEVVLLEGIRLGEVGEGRYFLNAAPINLGGLEGSPCRAWLADGNDI